MKRFFQVLFTFFVAMGPMGLWAQSSSDFADRGEGVVVRPRKLSVSCNKTSMLVFPAAIRSADRGAAYVLAKRVKGTDNVLKVKAGRPDFETSSLTVITADGQVYVFNVSYAASPASLVLDFRDHLSRSAMVSFSGQSLNSAELAGSAERAKGSVPFLKRIQTDKYGLDFTLEGIYTKKDVLFFKFRLCNPTSISYTLSSLNFFVRDLKTAKRTAMQDNELQCLYRHSWGRPEVDGGQVIVVAVPRFTIADNKKLVIELMENQGDRALSLDVKERKFRKAIKLDHQ